MLEDGGNSVDAVIAAAFVQGVTNPLHCGIGGTGSLYVWDAKTGRDVYLDFEGAVGSNEVTRTWEVLEGRKADGANSGNFQVAGKLNAYGPGAVLLPGLVRGCWDAYHRYGSGKLPWSRLLDPAVRLARDGFDVPPYSASIWRMVHDLMGKDRPTDPSDPATAVYASPEGTPYDVGDRCVQPDLGWTLSRLADAGGEDFYTGEIAARISEHFGDRSTITADDLAKFQTLEDSPIRGEYRGMDVAAQPFSNGSQLICMLHIWERLGESGLTPGSLRHVELLSAVMRASFEEYSRIDHGGSDRGRSLDPEIIATADEWADRLKDDPTAALGLARDRAGSRGTTQAIVVDSDGSIASINHSIGNNGAALVTPGLGFIYNNFMRFFDPRPGNQRSAEPGKRMGAASSLAFFADGSPKFVVGGAGGTRIVTAMLQTTVNVFDFGMDPQTAVATPRFHSQAGRSIFVEPRFDDGVASELESKGYTLSRSNYQARIQAIRIREDTDLAVDPRSQSGGRWPPPDMAADPAFA